MGKKTGRIDICLECGIEFWKYKSRNTIFCSKSCYSRNQLGKKLLPHVKRIAIDNLKKWAFKRIKNMPKGDNNPMWKGDRVGYRALHYWVIRQLGNAKKCSLCGKEKGKIHWANINHKYKRNVKDYFPACPSCHKYYDINMKKEMR